MSTKKKAKGRPPKKPKEKMYFGILCTEKECEAVWKLINQFGVEIAAKPNISEFFLRKIGVR